MSDYKKALAYPMYDNDADAKTVGDYLVNSLRDKLGKTILSTEPIFLNSGGWSSELAMPLVKGGFIKGFIVDNEYLYERKELNDYVAELIKYIFSDKGEDE